MKNDIEEKMVNNLEFYGGIIKKMLYIPFHGGV